MGHLILMSEHVEQVNRIFSHKRESRYYETHSAMRPLVQYQFHDHQHLIFLTWTKVIKRQSALSTKVLLYLPV